jgi:hypothetical protein
MRSVALVVVTLGVGCVGEAPGIIEAEGTWADGAPIHFAEAVAVERGESRVDVRAVTPGRARFAGIRLSYDPRRLTQPGRYPVDPEAQGWLELYCLRLVQDAPGTLMPQFIEYEVSAATLQVDQIPTAAGQLLTGGFSDVVLDRGQRILQLSAGSFRARLP